MSIPCVLYQVPCEAMFIGSLPVACNSGGPRETIIDGATVSMRLYGNASCVISRLLS